MSKSAYEHLFRRQRILVPRYRACGRGGSPLRPSLGQLGWLDDIRVSMQLSITGSETRSANSFDELATRNSFIATSFTYLLTVNSLLNGISSMEVGFWLDKRMDLLIRQYHIYRYGQLQKYSYTLISSTINKIVFIWIY